MQASSDLSEDDRPLASVPRASASNANAQGVANGKRVSRDSSSDTESRPPNKRARPAASHPSSFAASAQSRPAPPSARRKRVVDDSSSDDEPLAAAGSPLKQITALAIPQSNGEVVTSKVPLAGDAAEAAAKLQQVAKPSGDALDDSDDDVPLKSRVKSQPVVKVKDEVPDEDDVPLKAKAKLPKIPKKKKAVQKEESDANGSDLDAPSTSKAAPKKRKAPAEKKEKATPAKKKAKTEVKEEDESVSATPAKKGKTKKEKEKEEKEKEEEEEADFRWWEQQALGDGSKKWTTLEHHGVLFPQAYEPLPKNVKMLYDGKPVNLPPESEEVAGFFGAMLETEHAKDATFIKNFFNDWKGVLAKYPPLDGTKITDFTKCDFGPMYEYFEGERARKKALSAAEKKAIKAERDKAEANYLFCLLDGRKEKMGNFRAEPPGLFRGRGDHPKKGALKLRLHPSDITINIGKDSPIPKPNIPGEWGKIIHDDTVTWLAHWKENINGNSKYVFLAAGSSLKGQSDMNKFEKARELKKHIDTIRKDYREKLTSKMTAERQMATALYFIDKLALRAGNEKGEEEADTVGCCSLRYEHVTLQPPDHLVFDFLGKDSIRYYNVVPVEPQIYKNIRIFKGDGKTEGDAIFDRVTTTSINKHLTSYMKGLTAKVFRTYNASITFQEQLEERTPVNGSLVEKLAAYNESNRMVAILCNHQKAVSKNHGASMEKLENQIRAIKYQRRKLRQALFVMNKKYKKDEAYADDESDIDEDWIATYEDESRAKEIEKVKKKFDKDNEKKAEDGEKKLGEDVLEDRIQKVNDEYDRLKKERGTGKAEVKGKKTEDQIIAAIEKLDNRIKTEKFKKDDKEAGKEVSLGTSKTNYLDPRITTSWCKKHNVPVEKMFSKTLLTKFPWAKEIAADWKF